MEQADFAGKNSKYFESMCVNDEKRAWGRSFSKAPKHMFKHIIKAIIISFFSFRIFIEEFT